MMGLGPYRPIRELEGAIERRELDMAIGIAKDIARERRPIGLELALGLLALVADGLLSGLQRILTPWNRIR